MRWFKRITIGVIVLACAWLAVIAVGPKVLGGNFYLRRLDAWVAGGGSPSEIQSGVIANCGKLILASASAFDNLRYTTISRDDFDFRVDVCAKMTVNRVHKQPEFENEKTIGIICDGQDALFRWLCRRSGLRPN
jgi:hypothetical protein